MLLKIYYFNNASNLNLALLNHALGKIIQILIPRKFYNQNVFEILDILTLEGLYLYHFIISHYFDTKLEIKTNFSDLLRPRNTKQFYVPDLNNKHGKRTKNFYFHQFFSKIPKEYLEEKTYNSAKNKIRTWIKHEIVNN